MKYCLHFQLDEDTNKYVSLVTRFLGNKNPNRNHLFRCKRCGMIMHSVDVRNLENKINDMNEQISDDIEKPIWLNKSDIYDMLAPVPGVYHEDSKYRDNQQS